MATADPPERRTILCPWVLGKMGCEQRRRGSEPGHANLLEPAKLGGSHGPFPCVFAAEPCDLV
jgi:hypothetical protein